MSTALTNTVQAVRRLFLFFVLALLAYFLFSTSLSFLQSFFRRGDETLPPEARFGPLPELPFRGYLPTPSSAQAEYILETVTGAFPSLPVQLPAFPAVTPKKSLLAPERGKEIAAALGFKGEPRTLSPIEYFWQKKEAQQTLKLNILTLNFTLESTPSAYPGKSAWPKEESLVERAREILAAVRPPDKRFSVLKPILTWLKRQGQKYVPAEGPAEAEIARVDFFRVLKLGESLYPLYGPQPKKALVYFHLRADWRDPEAASATIWEYQFERGSAYPLKSAERAWEDLKGGQGAIVYLSSRRTDYLELKERPPLRSLTLREISLAFFDDGFRQNYLQPIYVFSGQADFKNGETAGVTIYLPALDPAWVVKS